MFIVVYVDCSFIEQVNVMGDPTWMGKIHPRRLRNDIKSCGKIFIFSKLKIDPEPPPHPHTFG